MTYVKVTYVALNQDGKPITTADNIENILKAVDNYFGVEKGQAECLGFYPFETKYPDEYEGYIEYKYEHNEEQYLEKIRIYCIEYFPHTVYEKN